MLQKIQDQSQIILPVKRPFHWRVYLLLVIFYFLGNLAGIPLLRRMGAVIEPVWYWGIVTAISAVVIGLSLIAAHRTGLGAPFLEGLIPKRALRGWLSRGLKHLVILLVISLPLSLIVNRRVTAATYPFGWELLLASFKAGVVEEIANRLFLVSFFTWIGKWIWHDDEGRPSPGVYWAAILLAGITFGWAHVDPMISNPAAAQADMAGVMILNTGLGIYFGWLFWKLGLEWAILAHFFYDAFITMLLIPLYLLI